jgi:26S proteasome regulatory subunit N2
VTPGAPTGSSEEKMDVDEKKEGEKEGEKTYNENEKKKREKEKVGYEIGNLSRVLPEQLKYISFPNDGRYEPVKKVCTVYHNEALEEMLILS